MKETINANVSGYAFTMENDAYALLEQYMNDIRTGCTDEKIGAELADDIEERVAELLYEKCPGGRIVTLRDIEGVKETIGDPSSLDGREPEETGNDKPKSQRRRNLYRDIDHTVLAGVFSGIAARYSWDLTYLRIAFSALLCIGMFFCGSLFTFCLVVYAILWICIPPAKTVEQKCEMYGQPLNLDSFKKSMDSAVRRGSGVFRQVGRELGSAPILHSIVRSLGVLLGVCLIIAGICGLVTCSLYDIAPDFFDKITGYGPILHCGHRAFAAGAMLTDTLWISILVSVIICSVWLLYCGVMLVFDFRAPSWRPGLILFLLFVLSLLVITAILIRQSMALSLTL